MYNYNRPMTGAMMPSGHPRAKGLFKVGAEPTTLDNLKAFMDKEYGGIKTKYILGGLAVAGIGYYGYTKGWF